MLTINIITTQIVLKKKHIKLLAIVLALCLSFSICSTIAYAAGSQDQNSTVEVSATIIGKDNSKARADGYGTVHGAVDIIDDNHAFNRKVEVWAVAETWLTNYSSGTANGIPDWYLYAKSQILVSNGDVGGWLSSPLNMVYDGTCVTAETRVVNAKDGGNAQAQGYHTLKDYNQEIQWTYSSEATENF